MALSRLGRTTESYAALERALVLRGRVGRRAHAPVRDRDALLPPVRRPGAGRRGDRALRGAARLGRRRPCPGDAGRRHLCHLLAMAGRFDEVEFAAAEHRVRVRRAEPVHAARPLPRQHRGGARAPRRPSRSGAGAAGPAGDLPWRAGRRARVARTAGGSAARAPVRRRGALGRRREPASPTAPSYPRPSTSVPRSSCSSRQRRGSRGTAATTRMRCGGRSARSSSRSAATAQPHGPRLGRPLAGAAGGGELDGGRQRRGSRASPVRGEGERRRRRPPAGSARSRVSADPAHQVLVAFGTRQVLLAGSDPPLTVERSGHGSSGTAGASATPAGEATNRRLSLGVCACVVTVVCLVLGTSTSGAQPERRAATRQDQPARQLRRRSPVTRC